MSSGRVETGRPGSPADRARAPVSAQEARAFYDEWAPTYDADAVGPDGGGHPLPTAVADLVARLVHPQVDVLDAACGTGLVGAALAARGFTSVDGLDVSPRMLARARGRRVYHDLGVADLSGHVPGAPDKFGVLTCVDALGPGHLPFSAVTGFARVVHRGGHIVLTVRDADHPALGAHLRELEDARVARSVPVAGAAPPPTTGPAQRIVVLEVVAASAPRSGPGT